MQIRINLYILVYYKNNMKLTTKLLSPAYLLPNLVNYIDKNVLLCNFYTNAPATCYPKYEESMAMFNKITKVTLSPQPGLDFSKNQPSLALGRHWILFIHVRMAMLDRIVHVF